MRHTFITLLSLAAQLHGVESFWRMICDRPIVTARMDPIISPGAIAGHTHAITGASGVTYDATYADLRASDCSSCQVTQDLSAYWVPQLYYMHQNGTYESVNMVTGITVYYLPRGDAGPAGKILAIPDGLRMIAGDPFRRSYNSSDVSQRAIGFSCLGGVGYTKSLEEITNCANGLRAEIFFPNCWDGVNLDSADHKSHMAYSGDDGNGKCPSSHPVKLVSIFFEAMFDVNHWKDDWWNGTTPPFVFAQGDPTGYGLHGDFMTGWDSDFLQTAVDTCTANSGLIEDCPVFDINYKKASSCQWGGSLLTTENVFGANGGLATLPGCNPVSYGPDEAPFKPSVCPDGSVVAAAQPVVSVATSAVKPAATSKSSSSPPSSSTGAAGGKAIVAAQGVSIASTTTPNAASSTSPLTAVTSALAPAPASPSVHSTLLTMTTSSSSSRSSATTASAVYYGNATQKVLTSTITSTQVLTNIINGKTSIYTTTIYAQETVTTSPGAVVKAASNLAVSSDSEPESAVPAEALDSSSQSLPESNGSGSSGSDSSADSDGSTVVTHVVEEIEYYTITRTLVESNTPYVQLYVIPQTEVSNIATTVTAGAGSGSGSGPVTKTIYETVTATTIVPVAASPVLASMGVLDVLPSMGVFANATRNGTTSVVTRYATVTSIAS